MERVVSILCSGMGLGVYIPSLLLDYRLGGRGIKTEVFVVESYFEEEKLEKLKENKKAFHNSFQVAVIGHKIAKGDILSNLDRNRTEELLQYWEDNKRRDFIMISGHWHVILESYIERVGIKNLNIDAIRMDSDVAPSWRQFRNDKNYFNEVWLFDNNLKDLPCRIPVNNVGLVPFKDRPDRFLVHGGGWGMGTYRGKIKELNEKGLFLDIIAYEKNEMEEDTSSANKYYLMDPDWSPWIKNRDGRHEFPPMYEVDRAGNLKSLHAEGYQSIFDVCMKCKGIISKPGGGTLLDSLAAATPVIFLDPIAKHEQTNASLWEELGFGIPYEKWAESGYSLDVLEELHNSLVKKRSQTPDYTDEFVKKYGFRLKKQKQFFQHPD